MTISGGAATATVQWSSPNYDYMIVDGFFKTHIVDILHTGHVHVFFEETHEVVFTEIAKPGKL